MSTLSFYTESRNKGHEQPYKYCITLPVEWYNISQEDFLQCLHALLLESCLSVNNKGENSIQPKSEQFKHVLYLYMEILMFTLHVQYIFIAHCMLTENKLVY